MTTPAHTPRAIRAHAPIPLQALCLVLASLLLAWSPIAAGTALARDAAGKPVVVSLGDSYASGEGTEPFYGQDSSNKHNNPDWLAHRSQLAWPGKLQIAGTTMADVKDGTWFFMATSGALVEHITTSTQTIEWKERNSSGSLTYAPQLGVISDKGIKDSVDYVTLSIGGNDLNFRGIMTAAAKQDIPFISSGNLDEEIKKAQTILDSTLMPTLGDTYQAILNATGDQATLVVVGYPHLLYDRVSNTFFNATKAKQINDVVDTFDTKMANLVASMGSQRIVYCDPRAAFSGHEAYAQDNYINSIILGPEDQDIDQTLGILDASHYSLHPNAKGHTAYASAVQPIIDELEAAHSPIAVKGIAVTPTTATLAKVGDTVQLSALVTPANATNKDYTWTSSNKNVATVSATGLVTAVASGTATITATTADGGFTSSCTVTVPAAPKNYTARFVNWDNTVLSSKEYPENAVPSYEGETPTKPSTAEYDYTFSGWDPTPAPLTSDATYTAQFEARPIEPPVQGTWTRLYGGTRYGTMESIVKEGFESSDWAVIATGDNFPDALVASSLAGYRNCPVVLTTGDALSEEAERVLQRLGVKRAYVMGGTSAVSQKVEDKLKNDLKIEVTRVKGNNRQETSLAAMDTLPSCDTIVIATGGTFADALSVGPWCYAKHAPILLTNNKALSDDQLAAIEKAHPTRIVIVGGTMAVPQAIEDELGKRLPDATISRIEGADRYQTARAIAEFETSPTEGMGVAHVAVATGSNFPDALAGAALCGKTNSALLLTEGSQVDPGDPALAFAKNNSADVQLGYVLGGPSAVSDNVLGYLQSLN